MEHVGRDIARDGEQVPVDVACREQGLGPPGLFVVDVAVLDGVEVLHEAAADEGADRAAVRGDDVEIVAAVVLRLDKTDEVGNVAVVAGLSDPFERNAEPLFCIDVAVVDRLFDYSAAELLLLDLELRSFGIRPVKDADRIAAVVEVTGKVVEEVSVVVINSFGLLRGARSRGLGRRGLSGRPFRVAAGDQHRQHQRQYGDDGCRNNQDLFHFVGSPWFLGFYLR